MTISRSPAPAVVPTKAIIRRTRGCERAVPAACSASLKKLLSQAVVKLPWRPDLLLLEKLEPDEDRF